jgi:predicted dehydrogenase
VGLAYLNDAVHEVCSLSLHFENRGLGIVHVSWLDPCKRRVMTVVGSKRMAVYDDMDPHEKIKIYDRGIDPPSCGDALDRFQYRYRYGDTYSPHLIDREPLKLECQSFIDSIVHNSPPKTDGRNGLHVVQVLEAADRSLHNGGGKVPVGRSGLERVGHRRPRTLVH